VFVLKLILRIVLLNNLIVAGLFDHTRELRYGTYDPRFES
jgi:hypothetical protein